MPHKDAAAEREYQRAYYQKRREDLLRRAKEHYEANRDDKLAYIQVYQKANPEVHRKANQRYQQSHRLERRGWIQNYRTRKRNQFVEDVDLAVVWKRDGGICGICHTEADPLDWHLDHIIAISNNGEHSYANTQVSHPACNIKKGARQ